MTYGTLVVNALEASKTTDIDVLNLNCFNNYSIKMLIDSISTYKNIFILEEHFANSGVGAKILYELNLANIHADVWIKGLKQKFIDYVGTTESILSENDMGTTSIRDFIESKITV